MDEHFLSEKQGEEGLDAEEKRAAAASEVRTAAVKARARTYLDSLQERNRQVLEYKFGFFDGREHTLQETGDFFGISRQRVYQILQQIKASASARKRNEMR